MTTDLDSLLIDDACARAVRDDALATARGERDAWKAEAQRLKAECDRWIARMRTLEARQELAQRALAGETF